MGLRRLIVERFRGICFLDWTIGSKCVCLVGPGDSTKSTVLDAVELVLSPYQQVTFSDADFHNCDVSEPIVITATVGDLPERLKSDTKYGMFLRGWSPTQELHDEPEDVDETVISIELRVDSSLEPVWNVVCDRSEPKQIGARDRELLGMVRLGDHVERHLAWGRGSALSRITAGATGIGALLAEAGRITRDALPLRQLPDLAEVAARAEYLAREAGVSVSSHFGPGLDSSTFAPSSAQLVLHDGPVPLRRSGLGTRRLTALALQRQVASGGGVVLVDELEHGLEPHRLRHLVRLLKSDAVAPGAGATSQLIVTTHSPVAVEEFSAGDLQIVRSEHGMTRIMRVPEELQGLARGAAEAFLARKVLVCEGKTEVGLCRALDDWWTTDQGKEPFSCLGVVPVEGGGRTNAPGKAIDFARLGYGVAFLGDSDAELQPPATELEANGIKAVLWADNLAIEERVALDLPWEGVRQVAELAMEANGCLPVRDQVAQRVGLRAADLPPVPAQWAESSALREAIGAVTKTLGCFKRIDLGEMLGKIVVRYLSQIAERDLARKIGELRLWAEQRV